MHIDFSNLTNLITLATDDNVHGLVPKRYRWLPIPIGFLSPRRLARDSGDADSNARNRALENRICFARKYIGCPLLKPYPLN